MYLEKFRLDDRVAFVTGGAQGIGLAIAEAMAEAGARVTIADISGAALADAATALSSKGYVVTTELLDVTDSEAVSEIAKTMAARHGRIDILVNNAGIARSENEGNRGREQRARQDRHDVERAIACRLRHDSRRRAARLRDDREQLRRCRHRCYPGDRRHRRAPGDVLPEVEAGPEGPPLRTHCERRLDEGPRRCQDLLWRRIEAASLCELGLAATAAMKPRCELAHDPIGVEANAR